MNIGQIFVSPRGTRVTILENSPERISFERTFPPLTGGTKSKAHRHTVGQESFTLLEGDASGSIDGRERALAVGAELQIPLGSTHVNPHTTADQTATIVQTVSPRSRAVEVYFTSWCAWLADGKADDHDEPTMMQIGAIIKEGGRGGTWASGLPESLQRVLLPALGVVAGLVGTRAVRVP
jgi:mannose-6-phosphate isomerase-like protein (cupin superfamily)